MPPASTKLAAGLLLLVSLTPAWGEGRARSGVVASAEVVSTESGEVISVHGAFKGVDGKRCNATLTLKCAISEKVLDQMVVQAPEGRFSGKFGPYELPFWPQTYVIVIRATADISGSADGKTKAGLDPKTAPPTLVKTVLVPVHVETSVEEQRAAQATVFRTTLLTLRDLFVEVERNVPAFKERWEKEAEAVRKEFDAWWKTWEERQHGVARAFADRSYLQYWGNPFVAEYNALAGAAEQVRGYAVRAVVNISGEEKLDPKDRGKSWDSLAAEGKLPSRVLREQFLYALASAFETLELQNPNESLVQAALSEVAEAFISLRKAFRASDADAGKGSLTKYRGFREKVQKLDEELGYFFRNRKSVLAGERKLQEQVEFLDRHLARLDDLEQAYQAWKAKTMQAAEVEAKEAALAADLVRGTLVLAIPRIQLAFDTSWGSYQSLIESYRGTPGFTGVDPPDTSQVRGSVEPILSEADAFLSNAHEFLVNLGEEARGIPPILDVVRSAEETAGSIRKLLDLCDDMDEAEDEKERLSKANLAQQRAEEIGVSLPKLKTRFEEAFEPPR